MAANSSFELTSLDFDTNKTSLKNFLRSQSVFKDFDFEGSNINILLDILSYNTFQNSFYINMLANESFLDSAQLRDSIISHAKELNYLPRSNKSSRVEFEPFVIKTTTDVQSLRMPKGTIFSGVVKGVSYNFVTDTTYINNTPYYNSEEDNNWFYISERIVPEDGTPSYITDPFTAYEGVYQTDTFVMDYTIEDQRFILTDPSIDTDSVTVTVTEDGGARVFDYIFSTTLLDVKNTDPRFFMQPAAGGRYEVVFGDNIIGRRPKNDAVITIEYRVCSGIDGNGVKRFTLDTDVGGYSGGALAENVIVIAAAETPGGSYGGEYAESVAQIRYKAPRYFQTQERAVTVSDYEILLKNQFPEIGAVAVFGGETFDPPLFGKVYISVKIENVDGLPDAKKQEYLKFIAPRSPLAIDPVLITPEILYYKLVSTVNYNINVTSARPDQIRTLVTSAIVDFNDTNLEDFNAILRKSKLINAIDQADQSIVSNETDIQIFKKIVPFLDIDQNVTVKFGVPLFNKGPRLTDDHPISDIHAVTSSEFVYDGEKVVLEDDGDGNLIIVTQSTRLHRKKKTIGTVDYATGTLQIIGFNIESYDGNEVRIYGLPERDDIFVKGNNIFSIGLDELEIDVETVRE